MVTARSEGFFPEPLELQGSLSRVPRLVKNPPANAGDGRDTVSIPGILRRCSGKGLHLAMAGEPRGQCMIAT